MSPGSAESTPKGGKSLPPPGVLEGKDIASVAKYIKSDKCRDIVVMLGAGVSTAAGIPDFRSPDTGLYANLAHLGLPQPEAVFDISYFQYNPKPFYALAHDLRPGKFRPTLTHSFVRLIHEKGLLLTCFTQNIDTLERRAGIPEDKIVEAHGSFASHHCIDCHAAYDNDTMMEDIDSRIIPKCLDCDGLVKPDIVFFGEQLPPKFFESITNVKQADLLIIAGTSLTVYPFAAIAGFSNDKCPRVLINLQEVGDLGDKPNDVLLLGQCDQVVEKLSKELGWYDELLRLWNETTQIKPAEAKETKSAEKEVEELVEGIKKLAKLEDDEAAENTPKPDTNPEDLRSDTEAKFDESQEPGPESELSPSVPQEAVDVPNKDKGLEQVIANVREGKL
ncbi:hypothetical protein AX15_003755 [Amanita polypyramis BW_CC]|nr:hypothetical protein AX15_003755 [Amanita polypyramis BW_CC]